MTPPPPPLGEGELYSHAKPHPITAGRERQSTDLPSPCQQNAEQTSELSLCLPISMVGTWPPIVKDDNHRKSVFFVLVKTLMTVLFVVLPHHHSLSERVERGGSCCLLKLRWMGTQRVQKKGVLSWLFSWACRAGTRDFCSALAALVSLVQNSFPHPTLFQFICPHHPASWAGSRAGSPVS